MTRINRADLLRTLETAAPGLSPKDVTEQSASYVFRNGMVLTYNDEVACRAKTALAPDLTGAVKAAPLVKILQKITADEITVEIIDGALLVRGKRERLKLDLQAEITLGIDAVERPTTWRPLPEDFAEAVSVVGECAATKDESNFALTCIHLTPKWIEACDNFQMTRYLLKTGLEKSFLVKRESLKHIVTMGMTKFSESETWVHFRNATGLILSCRRYIEDYPNLAVGLDCSGAPATLPKGLAEACEKANIITEEFTDTNRVLVMLRPGEMRVVGRVGSNEYSKDIKLKYHGPAISFMVSPKLLIELVKRHLDCEISADRLKVDGGKFTYVAHLFNPEARKAKVSEAADEE